MARNADQAEKDLNSYLEADALHAVRVRFSSTSSVDYSYRRPRRFIAMTSGDLFVQEDCGRLLPVYLDGKRSRVYKIRRKPWQLKAAILAEAGFPALIKALGDALEDMESDIARLYPPTQAAHILARYKPYREILRKARNQ